MNWPLALISICAVLATVSYGLTLLRLARLQDIPWQLQIGICYGLGIVVINQLLVWLSTAQANLGILSWGVLLAGLMLGLIILSKSISSTVALIRARNPAANTYSALFMRPYCSLFDLTLIGMLSLHVILILANNLRNPIFPWDAFTTWIYRAKLWTLDNTISTLNPVIDWVDAGGAEGYAIYATQYPMGLSVYAAFIATLSGSWHPASVSIVWGSLFISICAAMLGMLRLLGCSYRQAMVGAYLLGSMPLLNIHAALAGYADLWQVLFSGLGLALLLIWQTKGGKSLLGVAVALLLAGTQIKLEGWLWLALGLTFCFVTELINRHGYRVTLVLVVALAVFLFSANSTSLNLGTLGLWGVKDSSIHIGALGSYPLRPYNPAQNYFAILFNSANFLSLGVAYLLSLAVLSRLWRGKSAPFWLMGSMIALSQYIIFGLSVYSQYAETGTAITRLLLQFTPVAVTTVMAAWLAISDQVTGGRNSEIAAQTPAEASLSRNTSIWVVACMLIAAYSAPITVNLISAVTYKQDFQLQASPIALSPLVGKTQQTPAGIQFVDSPIPVGVLTGELKLSPASTPQYLLSNVTYAQPEGVAFYWITEGDPQVHSTAITISGHSMIDLNQFADWDGQSIQEYGYLVQKTHFENVRVQQLSLEDQALSAASLPALLRHWLSPETLSQKLINSSVGHSEAPVRLANLLNIGFFFAATLGGLLLLLKPSAAMLGSVGVGLLLVWGLADLAALNSSALRQTSLQSDKRTYSLFDDPSGHRLTGVAEQIRNSVDPELPIVVVSQDRLADFVSAKLPFLLLPNRAVSVRASQQQPTLSNWKGVITITGTDAAELEILSQRLLREGVGARKIVWQAEGIRVISPHSNAFNE